MPFIPRLKSWVFPAICHKTIRTIPMTHKIILEDKYEYVTLDDREVTLKVQT